MKREGQVKSFVGLYLFIYMVMSFSMSQYVPYLTNIGYSTVERGMMLSSYAVTTIGFQLLFGFLSDKYRAIKRFFVLGVALYAIAACLLFTRQDQLFVFHLLMVAMAGGLMNLNFGLMDNWVFELGEYTRSRFGFIRLFGSIGWAIGSTCISTIVYHFGYSGVAVGILFFTVISFCIAYFIADADKGSHSTTQDVKISDVKVLFRNKKYVLLTAILFLLYAMSATNNSAVLDKMMALGANEIDIGYRWTLMALVEIPTFFFGAYLLRKINPYRLLLIACSAYTIQFLIYGMATTPFQIILAGSLQIFTIPLIILVARVLIFEYSSDQLKSTGQLVAISLYNGGSSLLIPTIAGAITSAFQVEVTIYLTAILGGIAFFLSLMLWRMGRSMIENGPTAA